MSVQSQTELSFSKLNAAAVAIGAHVIEAVVENTDSVPQVNLDTEVFLSLVTSAKPRFIQLHLLVFEPTQLILSQLSEEDVSGDIESDTVLGHPFVVEFIQKRAAPRAGLPCLYRASFMHAGILYQTRSETEWYTELSETAEGIIEDVLDQLDTGGAEAVEDFAGDMDTKRLAALVLKAGLFAEARTDDEVRNFVKTTLGVLPRGQMSDVIAIAMEMASAKPRADRAKLN
jgi:hypothetical protein